jgi:carbon-monoxide dehydrogenase medium subunit/xanthine dehydrogenase FAD-binding subunit
MRTYDYFCPRNVLENASNDTYIISGGTDIILDINKGHIKPEKIININKIHELKYVKCEDGLIKIGSIVTFSDIENNEMLKKKAKALVEACKEIGSTQIRNLGTVGGNIVNSSSAADSVAALITLDASVVLKSKNEARIMKLVDFYNNGKSAIRKDELLTEIFFDEPSENTATAFTKLGRRKALAIVVMSMGALVEKDENNICRKVHFAFGAVGRHPCRLYNIEKKILDKEINRGNLYGLLDEMSETIYNRIVEGSPGNLRRLNSAKYKSKSIRGIAESTFESILSDLDLK